MRAKQVRSDITCFCVGVEDTNMLVINPASRMNDKTHKARILIKRTKYIIRKQKMTDMKIEFMSQIWTIRDAKPEELVDCLGLCDPRTNTIVIDPDLIRPVWLATLAHELIHVIEMTLNQCLTEGQVDTLAIGLIHLLKKNPGIIQLFNEEPR